MAKSSTHPTPDSQPPAGAIRRGLLQLSHNAGGHQSGETFTADQAKASGIDASAFQPFPGQNDRAMKPKDITTR